MQYDKLHSRAEIGIKYNVLIRKINKGYDSIWTRLQLRGENNKLKREMKTRETCRAVFLAQWTRLIVSNIFDPVRRRVIASL